MIEAAPVRDIDKTAMIMMAKKELKARKARESLRDFIEYCMPDPDHYADSDCTLYECRPVHDKIINLFTRTIQRELLRSAMSVPSQHGKSTVCAEYGLAWYAGNNPEHKVIYGTYSEPRAKIVGEKVRTIMESARFKEVFPEFEMRKGSKAKDFIGFGEDGSIMFLGRNSGGAGNPCNFFVIDDPYKNMGEAKSGAVRAEVWSWFTSVVEQRCPASTPIFIIHTRWNDDDLIGRLCDPEHPGFDIDNNDQFEYLKLPGIVNDPELAAELSMEVGGSLWPQKKQKQKDGSWKIVDHWPVWLFQRMKHKNLSTFSAMVMSDPVPPSGDFFTQEMIKPYKRSQLPASLIKYAASDHAVSTAKRADHSVIGPFGVCENGDIWILADVIWDKIDPVKQVEEMAKIIRVHKPRTWWAEADHIKKAILPFLKKKLRKEKLFSTYFDELPKAGDKQQKAQSIRAMAAVGMLHLPVDAPWYERAVNQILRFDGSEGRPDDFVDFLANIGRGLDKMQAAPRQEKKEQDMPATGTAAWVKFAAHKKKRYEQKLKAMGGW